MSTHDYMSRSGYVEDAYSDHNEKFPIVDVEGRRWAVSGYGRSLGTCTYIRKVESYVQEISKSKPAYSSSVTTGFPSKESGSFNSDGRPREVHDFLMNILMEVNGPPHNTGDPNLGTDQGEHSFPHEPPTRTSAPNVERVDVHEVDQRFGPYATSPMKVDPTGGPPVRPSDPSRGRGRYIFPVKEEIRDNYGDGHRYVSSLAKAEPTMGYGYDYEYSSSPRKSEKAHNHQWGQSSSPIYDHQPQGGYGVPNCQGGDYGLNSKAPRSSSPIYSHLPQRNNQLPHDKWGNPLKSQTQDYGAPNNPSPRKPSSFKDCEAQNNGRGGSPVKLHTSYGYGVSTNNTSAAKREKPKEHKIPDSQWGNLETRDYGVRNNKWDKSSNPILDHTLDNTEKQLGGSTMNSRGYGVSGNQWDRSSSPVYNHPQNPPSSPKDQWGSSRMKIHSPRDSGATVNQLGRSSGPVYDHQQNKTSGSKDPWGSSPTKTQSPEGYGLSSNQWDRPSSPSYDHPPNDEQHKTSQVTCKDGVCTLNNKPKAPQGTYDEPKGNTNRFPVIKLKSYSDDQYGTEGLRAKPYSPDHQPKDFGRTTNNQMMPSGYNLGGALEQMNLDAWTPSAIASRSSAPAVGFSRARTLTVLPHVGPIRETMVGPRDIDSKAVVRRYGGCSIPEKPYASERVSE